MSFPRSPRDSSMTTLALSPRTTISRFSSRPRTEPVGASLHEFDRPFRPRLIRAVSRAGSGSLPPSSPPFSPSPANYASSRKKKSGYYTRVLLVNSLFPPFEIPSARNALAIRNRTYKYPRFLPAIIFYFREARL